jgi:hypothetical protein
MFVLMPDKLLESYTAVMQGLTTLLSDQGLALAAQSINQSINQSIKLNFHFIFM